MPRCVGDILVLLCHRDDETRREAAENFTNTLKTIERYVPPPVAPQPALMEGPDSMPKAKERISKNSRYTDMLDVSKFKDLYITVPAEPPIYQAEVKEEKSAARALG